jgi:RNA 3'-terminal phosphate cyclase (ATP)
MRQRMIELDGSAGEGGGQVLRTALTLSMITGQPFRITKIRARRAKPGLMRQHLVAVQAAAEVSDAQVTDAQVGSQELTFAPKPVRPGDYEFAIGTAGSCTLVLQTILPALLYGGVPSTVRITGGTHNPMAPPVQFLQRAYCRVLAAIGARIDIELLRAGFYPAGGGVVVASVTPCTALRPLELLSRGRLVSGYAEGIVARIPVAVAKRELECVGAGLGWAASQLLVRSLPADQGPGNALLITLECENVTEVFAAFGEKAIRAEAVARSALEDARRYIASNAAVGEHLADQLMLPMALAGAGCFSTERVSQHALTNSDTIARFLPIDIVFEDGDNCAICVAKTSSEN